MANKRLNYFTGQFLNAEDFKDEQQYHAESLRAHNRNLHTWGIAKGFDVEKIGSKNVTISRGMAIDSLGRQIILDQLKEIDLSASTSPTLYLTISYNEQEIDFKEEEGEKGNTRIIEEPVIEYNPNEPDEPSMKIILARLIFDREKDVLDSIDVVDRKHVKTIGGDIESNSIVFSLPADVDTDKFPSMKGVGGTNPGIEIISENTTLKGSLNVSGKLSGTLEHKMVGTDQIVEGSVPISKMKTVPRSGSAEIGPKSESKVEYTEPSAKHRFFITSVIPITPESVIEWKWQVEKEADQLYYILVVKNLSKKKIDIEYMYYEILE
ncbi:hypothetical protein GQ543_04765 [candidate division WOR-3 bacterium]|nr:hypothetical protein [candidate division WOR-3 bacterium]